MELPELLRKVTNEVLEQVRNSSDFVLLPKYRLEIYRAMGSFEDPLIDKTYKWLSFLTASHVVSIWKDVMGDDDFAPGILNVAEGLLRGKLTLKETERDRDLFYHASESEVYNEDIPINARAVKEAAYLALKVVTGSNNVQSYTIDLIERGLPEEIIIEEGDFDVACPAVLPFAGFNFEGDEEEKFPFDPSKRKEFWEWWLAEAIPQAWVMANCA